MDGTLINPLTGLPIDDTELKSLSDLVDEQVELEGKIKAAEEELKLLNARHNELSGKLIPDKLDVLGLSQIKTSNGRKVEVKPFYSCKILSSDAYKWLDENGHGGIIKTKLVRNFMRDERDKALEYQKEHPEFTFEESIHFQTLSSFVKEMAMENQSLPEEYFSVYEGKKTKIS